MEKKHLNKLIRIIPLATSLILFSLLFFGCPSTIDTAMATLAEDDIAPEITLIAPAGKVYRSSLTISGSIVDYVDDRSIETGGLKTDSLIWGILNKSAEKYNGTFTSNDDGTFSFSIADTSELAETIVVHVEATDLSGNTGIAEVTLEPYTLGPYIVISSPADNEEWANEYSKTVAGYIRNSSSDETFDEINFDSVSVTVNTSENSSTKPENLTINEEDGTFAFTFDTYDLSSRQPITVSVKDRNGNPSQKTIYIVAASAGPYIEIISPAEQSIYNRDVSVTGRIAASSSVESGMEGVTFLSIALLGTGLGNNSCSYTLDPAAGAFTAGDFPSGYNLSFDWNSETGDGNGSFTYTFDTEGKENDIIIQVTAENINGQQTVLPLTLRDDNEGPYITITSPRDYDVYESIITVSGIVRNNANDPKLDEIESMSWSVSESTMTGDLTDAYDITDGSFNFEIPVPLDQAGRMTIEIEGTDINGNKTMKYLLLQDNNSGPEISISTPENYSYFGAGDNLLRVTGTIRDSEGETGSAASVTTASWTVVGVGSITPPKDTITLNEIDDTFDFNLDTSGITESSFTLRVSAVGADGHISSSDTILSNDNTAPILTFTAPTPSEMDYYQATLDFAGTFKDGNNTSDVLDDISALSWDVLGTANSGAWDVSTLTEGSFAISDIDASLFTGSKTIRVTAIDNNGNTASITRTLMDDRQGPAITIDAPANNSFFGEGANSINVTGTILNSDNTEGSGGSISGASWSVLGSSTSSATDTLSIPTDGSFDFNVPTNGITESTIIVRISASGIEGHENSFDLVLNNDRQAPVISFTSPGEMDYYYGEISFSGTYEDGNQTPAAADDISTVTWELPGESLSGTVLPLDGTFDVSGIDSSTFNGNQSIRITVTDENGNTTTGTRVIQSSSEGPCITVTSPDQDSYFGNSDNLITVTGTILDAQNTAGTGTSVSTAEWEVPNTALGDTLTILADGNFTFDVNSASITAPSLIVRISATAINSNESTLDLNLLNDREAPVISFSSPDEMSFYHDEIAFSWTVLDADYTGPIDSSDTDDISSVSWEILGVSSTAGLSLQSTGNYSVSGLDSTAYSGNKTIMITAVDKNGNTSTATRTLADHTEGPDISIDYPDCYPYYDHIFSIEGNISHIYGHSQINQTVGTLQWQWDGDGSWNNFTISNIDDGLYDLGDFEITGIDSADKTGTQSIIIKAEDVNGDITEESLTLLNDGNGVNITVTEPASGSHYATVVPVSINISDYTDLKTLPQWKFDGLTAFEDLSNDTGGNYSVDINTGGYTTNLSLIIWAKDVHENETVETIALVKADSSIPSFSVESKNGSVTATWDDVPYAENYSIYYTEDGTAPILNAGSYPDGGTKEVDSLSSGDSISGLTNGKNHIFVLKADLSEPYSSSFSEEIYSVPLSPLSFCPSLRQESPNSVIMEWPDYGGGTGFTVWRRLNDSTSWQKISSTLSINTFTDNNVTEGDVASYQIRPVNYSNIWSEFASRRVHYLDIDSEKTSTAGISEKSAQKITVWEYNSHTYLASRSQHYTGYNKLEILDVSDPDTVSLAGSFDITTGTETITGIKAVNQFVFVTSYTDYNAAHLLKIFDISDMDTTGITLHASAPLDIEYDPGSGMQPGTRVYGIDVWYGDTADVDSDDEYWVFLIDPNLGIFVVEVTASSASVVNILDDSWNVCGTPMIYSEDGKEKLSFFDLNGSSNVIRTIVDFPSLDFTETIDYSDTDVFTVSSSNSNLPDGDYQNLTVTDGENFFIYEGNGYLQQYSLIAVRESDMSYVTYNITDEIQTLTMTNGFVTLGGSDCFLKAFKVDDIDFSGTDLVPSQQWGWLPQSTAAYGETTYTSESNWDYFKMLRIGADALALSPVASVSTTNMDLEQNIISGKSLYTYEETSRDILKWDLSSPESITGSAATGIGSSICGGLFTLGDSCYLQGNSLYEMDFEDVPVTSTYYFENSFGGQSDYQAPVPYGHFMFTGGYITGMSARQVLIYDISAPDGNDLTLQYMETAGTENFHLIRRTGDYIMAFQYKSPELFIIDVSDWTDPHIVNSIDIPETVDFDAGWHQLDLIYHKGNVYLTYSDSDIYTLAKINPNILPIADWSSFSVVGTYDSSINYIRGLSLCASGNYIFTAYSDDTDSRDIIVYRIDETLQEVLQDCVYASAGTGKVSGLHTDGSYLYVVHSDSSGDGGIDILSIDDAF